MTLGVSSGLLRPVGRINEVSQVGSGNDRTHKREGERHTCGVVYLKGSTNKPLTAQE